MKLSIIVPVYNLENYIATTLESLLSIHFSSDYEIIVINDGSTDRSESVIRDYQQKHSQIVLYTIDNQGVSNARNLGISKAMGEYITFVDGDDTVEPGFFEKAVSELDKGGYDFVQGNFTTVDKDRTYSIQHTEDDLELRDKRDIFELFYAVGRKKIHNTVWGKVFRAEVIRKMSFDKTLSVAEDHKFVFDVICNAKCVKLLKDQSINYHLRNSSAIHTKNTKKYYDKLTVLAYSKQRIPYPEIKIFIEYHQLCTLLGLYYDLTELRDTRSDEVRKEILKFNYKQIKPYLDKKTLVVLSMLRYTRILYDFYIRNFSR